jgi:hypothetical protein
MGCDIHVHVEVRNPTTGEWEEGGGRVFPDAWQDGELVEEPFGNRSYGMFGFFADVRNYSDIPLNFGPMPRGIPDDSPYSKKNAVHQEYGFGGYSYDVMDHPWDGDYHSHSYLTLRELVEFDYDQQFEDRRATRDGDGGCTSEPGGGTMTTYREFLKYNNFFEHIEILKTLGGLDDVRIVFWFDS